MNLKNTKDRYGWVSQFFHWIIALLVIAMLGFGFFLGDMPKDLKPAVYMLHKSTGLLILLLMCLRILWKGLSNAPNYPAVYARWQQILATATHHSLYLLLIAMPVTGLIMAVASRRLPRFFELFTVTIPGVPASKSLATLMNTMHKTVAWLLIVLITLHLVGVFYHTCIKKDGLLRRMMPHKKHFTKFR